MKRSCMKTNRSAYANSMFQVCMYSCLHRRKIHQETPYWLAWAAHYSRLTMMSYKFQIRADNPRSVDSSYSYFHSSRILESVS